MANHYLDGLAYVSRPVYGGPRRDRQIDGIEIRDVQWGGNCYIAGEGPDGIVTIDGVPAQRIVRLVDRKTGIAVRQVMSNADGTYRFDNLRGDRLWMVIGIDHLGTENAVIADLVTAMPMPKVSPT